jgi:pilus assembly protein CpaB
MTPARIAIVVGALVASIALALIVRNLIGHHKAAPIVAAAPAPVMTQVLVAKTDLGVGSILTADTMRWQDWPSTGIDPSFITSGQTTPAAAPGTTAGAINQAKNVVASVATGGGPKMQAMIGAIVREQIAEGEPITAHKVVRAGQSSYMAVRLPEGMRAMALPRSVESGAGGFIEPGDHVDVLSTHQQPTKNGSMLVTDTVLSDTLVLAIDQHTDSPKGGANLPGATITIEVPAGMAYAVAKARTQGGLTLALRSYADAGPSKSAAGGDTSDVRIFRGGSAAEVVTAQ